MPELTRNTIIPREKSCNSKKYPLDDMDLEDNNYFEIDRPKEEIGAPRSERYRTLRNLRSHITNYLGTENGLGKRFVCRHIENGTKIGCWRIE